MNNNNSKNKHLIELISMLDTDIKFKEASCPKEFEYGEKIRLSLRSNGPSITGIAIGLFYYNYIAGCYFLTYRTLDKKVQALDKFKNLSRVIEEKKSQLLEEPTFKKHANNFFPAYYAKLGHSYFQLAYFQDAHESYYKCLKELKQPPKRQDDINYIFQRINLSLKNLFPAPASLTEIKSEIKNKSDFQLHIKEINVSLVNGREVKFFYNLGAKEMALEFLIKSCQLELLYNYISFESDNIAFLEQLYDIEQLILTIVVESELDVLSPALDTAVDHIKKIFNYISPYELGAISLAKKCLLKIKMLPIELHDDQNKKLNALYDYMKAAWYIDFTGVKQLDYLEISCLKISDLQDFINEFDNNPVKSNHSLISAYGLMQLVEVIKLTKDDQDKITRIIENLKQSHRLTDPHDENSNLYHGMMIYFLKIFSHSDKELDSELLLLLREFDKLRKILEKTKNYNNFLLMKCISLWMWRASHSLFYKNFSQSKKLYEELLGLIEQTGLRLYFQNNFFINQVIALAEINHDLASKCINLIDDDKKLTSVKDNTIEVKTSKLYEREAIQKIYINEPINHIRLEGNAEFQLFIPTAYMGIKCREIKILSFTHVYLTQDLMQKLFRFLDHNLIIVHNLNLSNTAITSQELAVLLDFCFSKISSISCLDLSDNPLIADSFLTNTLLKIIEKFAFLETIKIGMDFDKNTFINNVKKLAKNNDNLILRATKLINNDAELKLTQKENQNSQKIVLQTTSVSTPPVNSSPNSAKKKRKKKNRLIKKQPDKKICQPEEKKQTQQNTSSNPNDAPVISAIQTFIDQVTAFHDSQIQQNKYSIVPASIFHSATPRIAGRIRLRPVSQYYYPYSPPLTIQYTGPEAVYPLTLRSKNSYGLLESSPSRISKYEKVQLLYENESVDYIRLNRIDLDFLMSSISNKIKCRNINSLSFDNVNLNQSFLRRLLEFIDYNRITVYRLNLSGTALTNQELAILLEFSSSTINVISYLDIDRNHLVANLFLTKTLFDIAKEFPSLINIQIEPNLIRTDSPIISEYVQRYDKKIKAFIKNRSADLFKKSYQQDRLLRSILLLNCLNPFVEKYFQYAIAYNSFECFQLLTQLPAVKFNVNALWTLAAEIKKFSVLGYLLLCQQLPSSTTPSIEAGIFGSHKRHAHRPAIEERKTKGLSATSNMR